MKRLIAITLTITTMAVLLCGCASTKLADSFDKDKVQASAEKVIGYLNDKDYDSVVAMFQEDLKKQLAVKDLKTVMEDHDKKAGAFVKFKNSAIIGQKLKATGEDYAVAVVVAKYEKKNSTYTISFNTNMEVIGLYVK